jgi:DNA-binding IscR family transcriptional regulator
MRLQALTNKVLRILAENAKNNASPQVMDSDTLARKLDISLPETRQLLKALHASGVIISNMEGQYSLITQEGMEWLNQLNLIPGSCQVEQ